jgi:hypothetical protein
VSKKSTFVLGGHGKFAGLVQVPASGSCWNSGDLTIFELFEGFFEALAAKTALSETPRQAGRLDHNAALTGSLRMTRRGCGAAGATFPRGADPLRGCPERGDGS